MKPTMFVVETEGEGKSSPAGLLSISFMRRQPQGGPAYVALYYTESTDHRIDLVPVPGALSIISKEQDEEAHWEGCKKAAGVVYGSKRGQALATNSMIRDISDKVGELLW